MRRDTSRSISRNPHPSSTSSRRSGSSAANSSAAAAPTPRPMPRRFQEARTARPDRRRHVRMGPLHRTDVRTGAGRPLDPVAELVGEERPHVGVVLVRVLRDARAVHREGDRRRHGSGAAVGHDLVDAQQVHRRVHRHELALRVGALVGDGVVAHVGVERPVPGQPPDRGVPERQPGRAALVVGTLHAGRDACHQELRVGGVEARLVGGEVVVEVGAEELPRARRGCASRRSTARRGARRSTRRRPLATRCCTIEDPPSRSHCTSAIEARPARRWVIVARNRVRKARPVWALDE